MKTTQTEQQHLEHCRQLEAISTPSTLAGYLSWVRLWQMVYEEETLRVRSHRNAVLCFHQAGGSGRKQPLLEMTAEIEAAAHRSTNQYSRSGRARLCALRTNYKPLGAQLWRDHRNQEAL